MVAQEDGSAKLDLDDGSEPVIYILLKDESF